MNFTHRRPCPPPRAALALRLLLPVGLVAVLCSPLWAHGDLHVRIEAATAEIANHPGDAKIYVLRAELYRLHAEFDLALADLDKAAELQPDLADTSFIRARVYVDLKMPVAALAAFNRHLKAAPTHVDGFIGRAQLLHSLKRDAEAAADYANAIAQAKDPLPEQYIERARLLISAAGDKPADGYTAAIACLNEGIAKIGEIVTLQLEAIEVETAAGQYDHALQRIEREITKTPRPETWLERKGLVLEKAGRKQDAWNAYRDGLVAIERLPDRTQRVQMVQELKSRLTANLQRLSDPPAPSANTPTPAPQ